MTIRILVLAAAACHAQVAPLQSRAPVQEPAPRVAELAPVEAKPAWFEPQREVVTSTTITILDQISFVGDTTRIHVRSLPMLDAMAHTLSANADLCVVEVGATPDTELGEQRATAIVDALVSRGVDRGRLRATRVGGTDPLTRFLILERADASGSCSGDAAGTS